MQALFHHMCIQTNDYRESLKFYQSLGFVLEEETENFHGRSFNTWLKLGDFYIELQTGKSFLPDSVDSNTRTGIVHFCLWVERLSDYVEQLELPESSFQLHNDNRIYQAAGGNLCKIKAPDGTIVEIRDKKSF